MAALDKKGKAYKAQAAVFEAEANLYDAEAEKTIAWAAAKRQNMTEAKQDAAKFRHRAEKRRKAAEYPQEQATKKPFARLMSKSFLDTLGNVLDDTAQNQRDAATVAEGEQLEAEAKATGKYAALWKRAAQASAAECAAWKRLAKAQEAYAAACKAL